MGIYKYAGNNNGALRRIIEMIAVAASFNIESLYIADRFLFQIAWFFADFLHKPHVLNRLLLFTLIFVIYIKYRFIVMFGLILQAFRNAQIDSHRVDLTAKELCEMSWMAHFISRCFQA